jgi:spermidine/putrescine ABC transporter ATP-binding subunit
MTISSNLTRESKDEICLEVKNVVKQYSDVTAVDHVSLKIKKGEIFSFLGPSGCGKSTLLRLIAGLESMSQGDIYIDGKCINDLPPYKRDCSTVFQTHALFPHMNVTNNIAFGLVERKLPKKEIKRKVAERIALVNLEGMENRFPEQLSGGQRQRVALARSLVLEPMILLLDEPLAALDRKLRKEMQLELKRIQREVGTTFLNVTHDQKEALSVSDRIGVMNDGKFLQIGAPDEIYETPCSVFVASFMGASNIFSGKYISGKEGKISLKTEDGLRICGILPGTIEPDEVAGFSIHPELINLESDKGGSPSEDPEQDTQLHGKVVEVFYQGDFSEYAIALKETKKILIVNKNRKEMGQEKKLSEGEDVIVSWECHHNNILME